MRNSLRVLLDKSLLAKYPNPPFANGDATAILTGTVPVFCQGKRKKRLIRTMCVLYCAPGILITREQYIHG